MGFAGGSHSFNRYTYANNNPYKYVDPDGETPVHVAAFATGFVIAAGSEIYNNPEASFLGVLGAGAIGGAVGLASTFGGGWIGTMGMGGFANGLGEIASQTLKGEFKPYKVVNAFIIGAAGGGLGKGGAQALTKRRGFPNNTLTQSQHNMTPSTTPRILQNSYNPAYTDARLSMAEVQVGTAYGIGVGLGGPVTDGFYWAGETISDFVLELPEWYGSI